MGGFEGGFRGGGDERRGAVSRVRVFAIVFIFLFYYYYFFDGRYGGCRLAGTFRGGASSDGRRCGDLFRGKGSGVVLRVGETGGPSGICQRVALQGGLSIHLSLSAKCHCDDVSIQSCSWQRAPL